MAIVGNIDPALMHAVMAGVVELLMIPIIIFIVERVVGRKLDDIESKRDKTRELREKQIEDDKLWQDSMTCGMRALLRGKLVAEHRKCIERGYAPVESKEYVSKVYEVYHDGLHGNGLGTAMYDEVMAMPTCPRDDITASVDALEEQARGLNSALSSVIRRYEFQDALGDDDD